MHGVSMMPNQNDHDVLPQVTEGSLLAELTCGDIDRQRMADAFVRVM